MENKEKKTPWFKTWLKSTPWIVLTILMIITIINFAAAGSAELNPAGNIAGGLIVLGSSALTLYKVNIR